MVHSPDGEICQVNHSHCLIPDLKYAFFLAFLATNLRPFQYGLKDFFPLYTRGDDGTCGTRIVFLTGVYGPIRCECGNNSSKYHSNPLNGSRCFINLKETGKG